MTVKKRHLEDFYNLAERFVEAVETLTEKATEKEHLRRINRVLHDKVERLEKYRKASL
jgi:cell shape-determining protein MreC